jgi:O-antigen/teichoic acid export membrane protein
MFKRGLLGYLPANILQGLIGFATLTVFTRILSPDDYGRYALAFGVSSLVYTVFFTWMEAAMARFFVGENRDDAEAPALYGTVYRLFIGVVLVFAALSAIGIWLWQGNPALKLAIGYSLATIIPRSLVRLVQEQRRAEGRVGQASVIDMVQTAGGFVIGVGCALAGLGGASPIIGTGLIAALCLPLVAREDWGRAARGTFDTVRARTYAQYGFPVAASLILTLALYTADRFLIAHYLSEAQAGAYHAGFSLASRILDVLFIWFGAAGAPAMVHALESGGEGALKATARQQLTTMAFVLFPAVGGLIMVAPSLGGLIIGGPLREAALRVTPLITIGALFSGLNTYYFLQAFTLAKKTRLLVVAMAIPAISNIVLNVLMIPRMGLVGAGLASALSFGLGLAGSWLLGLNTLRLPVPVIDLVKIGLSTAFMMVVLSLLPSWGGLAELLSRAIAGLAIYGGLAWLLDLNGIRHPAQRVLERFRAKVLA